MENRYQISGWALTIYGAFNVIGFMLSYSYVAKLFASLSGISLLALVIINVLIAVSFLAFLCGIFLLKNNSAVHKIALPVSIVILLSVPRYNGRGFIFVAT